MLLELRRWWRGRNPGELIELDDGVANMLIRTGFAVSAEAEDAPNEDEDDADDAPPAPLPAPRSRRSRVRSTNMELRE